jgi:putative ABC transport system permease protein
MNMWAAPVGQDIEMSVIIYKIWRDLWAQKLRTLQVVLIIAMGAFAVGMIITTRNLMIPGMEQLWHDCHPAMITMWADPTVDDNTITAIKGIEGVENAEGFADASIEWRLDPANTWSGGELRMRNDYEQQTYTTISLLSGQWPADKFFAIGQGTDTQYDIKEGQTVYIRVNDHESTVKISGIVYDPVIQPPSFGGPAQFYTTRDRFGELTGDRDFNRIMAGAAQFDQQKLTDIANKIERKLEKEKVDSGGASPPEGDRVGDPNKHFFQDPLDGIFLVLGIMAVLALLLGLFLVYNTINAIITQQTDQIGIMKAIGANTWQIIVVYLSNVFAYGLLALIIAVPLGVLAGWQMNVFLMAAFNAEPGPFSIEPTAIWAQVAISLLTPLLVSLVPVLSGARVTVREAVSTYGLRATTSLLDRLLAKMQWLSRSVVLIISNTFRHRGRVILTQISLVLSGLIFMMVLSVWDSTAYTFGDFLFSILKFNVSLVFEDPERIGRVETLALAHPDVKAVEMWHLEGGHIRPAGREKSDDDKEVNVFGVPLPTELYGPQLQTGRWLQPGDTNAIVLNQKLAEEAGVGVGDWVKINHGVKGDTTWQVVGLLFDPVIYNSAHVSRDTLLRELNTVGKTNTIWIQTHRTDPASEAAIAKDLRLYFDAHQVKLYARGTFGQDSASEITANVLGQFATIIKLLATIAVVIGVVGAVALSGTLSLNVLERRREIGVMRAVGASSWTIARLFIGEGLILGWLSWLIALPLSIPAGRLMTDALAEAVRSAIIYNYTPAGALYWLGIITVMSIVASLLPARGAMRISVQESLAYQ